MRTPKFSIKSGVYVAFGAALLLGSISAHATRPLDCSSGDGRNRGPLRVVGLTDDGHLVCFAENFPRRFTEIGYVSGLVAPDTRLIGIDFRVQGGALYGVGNGGGVYKLDTASALATPVNSLSVALEGTSFGVDFNPAADRLRIVSDTGQNLRHNVNAGGVTATDAVLNYTVGTPALGVAAVAYTNNDYDAITATTLFDLDTSLDQIAIQSPPNNGSLVATGKLTIDAGPIAGFDIYSRVRAGVAEGNSGYAVVAVANESWFVRIGLTTGRAHYVGKFNQAVVDIAVPLNQ